MDEFEKGLRRALRDHNDQPPAGVKRRVQRKQQPLDTIPGYTVILAVRKKKRLSPDVRFEYESTSISKLEARIEAEKKAREAGYPVIGYVIDYVKREAGEETP